MARRDFIFHFREQFYTLGRDATGFHRVIPRARPTDFSSVLIALGEWQGLQGGGWQRGTETLYDRRPIALFATAIRGNNDPDCFKRPKETMEVQIKELRWIIVKR